MRLIQISDPHLFADSTKKFLGVNTAESFVEVVKLVANTEKADLVILTGDLAQDCSRAAYEYALNVCQIFSCPVYWLAGNHDAPLLMQEVFMHSKIANDKYIKRANWQFILLNSHYPTHVEGSLAVSELDFLEACVEKDKQKYAWVFLHHHPLPLQSEWLDRSQLVNSEALWQSVTKYPQIKGLACGHVHQEYATEYQGIALVTAPATSIQFLPRSEKFGLDDQAPGYRWFEFNEDGSWQSGVQRLENFKVLPDHQAAGY